MDAVRYLAADYVVDNTKLKATGYTFLFPDFHQSMLQMKPLPPGSHP
jgi:hypothetical protein